MLTTQVLATALLIAVLTAVWLAFRNAELSQENGRLVEKLRPYERPIIVTEEGVSP